MQSNSSTESPASSTMKPPTKPLSTEQKDTAIAMFLKGCTSGEIASRLGVAQSRITNIKPRSVKIREQKERSRKLDRLFIPHDSSSITEGRGR